MGKIADLTAKFQALLVKINARVASKLDATATAVNSSKLESKSLTEVRALASNDALNQIAIDQSAIVGQYGEIAVFDETGVPMALRGETMMKTINLIASDSELNTVKAAMVPFSEVFNKWRRTSHGTSGVFPAIPSELTGWSYDAVSDSVSSTINSSSVIGLMSNDRFEEYILEAILKSTNADDDGVGICLAFAKIGTREHTLIAMVDSGGLSDGGSVPGGNIPKLVIAINYGQGAGQGHQLLASLPLGVGIQGWTGADFSPGVRLLVKRLQTGMFEVTCTKADGSPWPTPVYWTGPIPAIFSGSSAIGFVSYSQAGATWTIQQMPSIKRDIIDIRTMIVTRWNGNAWGIAGSAMDHNVLMPGRLYKDVFGVPYKALYLDHDGTFFELGAPQSISL
ncbi:hypothetical protein D3C85_15610 [compost metagenome]